MPDSAIIDVAVGLAFIFLLVSLLVTAATEILAGYLRWRSTQLWGGLERLLQSADLRNQLYKHPLVRGLSNVALEGDPNAQKGRNGPSYIPSRTFALALIDIVRRPQEAVARLETTLQDLPRDRTLFKALGQALDGTAADAPPCVRNAVAALRATVLAPGANGTKEFAGALATIVDNAPADAPLSRLRDWLKQADTATDYHALFADLTSAIEEVEKDERFEQLQRSLRDACDAFEHKTISATLARIDDFLVRGGLKGLSDVPPATFEALRPLLRDAAEDVEKFRTNVEIWFNDGMDRVSGWYKRRTGHVQAITAFTLAACMNIDALQITRTLWREPTLRRTIVASAEAQLDRPLPPTGAAPAAAGGPAAAAPPAEAPAAAAPPADADVPSTAAFKAIAAQIGVLGLPIGWSCPVPANETRVPDDSAARTAALSALGGPLWCTAKDSILTEDADGGYTIMWQAVPSRVPLLLMMMFGWAITAAAASLGAPFWFDTLKRIVSIRSSGKSPEEKPLPPKTVPQPLAPGQTPKDAALLAAFNR